MYGTLPRRFSLAVPLVALAIALVAPGAASAGLLVASAPNCAAQTLSQPFLPWLDPAYYTLVPGGSFEAGTPSWSRSGASVASGNETFYVGSKSDSKSLSIPAGASATSPTMCVGIGHPTIRFFSKRTAGLPLLSTLSVKVQFEDALGNVQTLPIGAPLSLTSSWTLSAPLPVVANLLPLLPNDMTPVRFRFSSAGGSFRIDDVYVDPYQRH